MPTKTTVLTPSLSVVVHVWERKTLAASYRHHRQSTFRSHCCVQASPSTLLHLAVSGAAATATANDTGQSKWSIFACFTTSQVHLDSIFLCIRKSTLGRKQKPNNFHHYRIFPEPGNNALPLVAPMASFRSIVSRFAPTALHAVLLVGLFRRSVLFFHI